MKRAPLCKNTTELESSAKLNKHEQTYASCIRPLKIILFRMKMSFYLLIAALVLLVSCSKDDDEILTDITGNITVNTTWTSGNVYTLKSRVAIVSGVTLTIEPGVIVKGEYGTGANATCLIVARGGKLMAEGTPSSPIIFTSIADEIMPGEIISPNVDSAVNGLWGGLIVLGNAPISAASASMQIEGIPATDPNGLYGGTVDNDNSGVIRYVSIRHGGANIGEGNEINGLTLGGVGSGTTIDHIEIVANQDDGVEWFGGSVDVSDVLVWNNGDDAIDTDQAWSGTLDNFVVISPGDECFELDGGEGAADATHTITNGSVYAGNAQGLIDIDADSYVDLSNIYFFGLAAGQDVEDTSIPGTVTCSSWQATLPAATVLTDFFTLGSDAWTTAVAAGTNTVGADISEFSGWSYAAAKGALADF